MAGRIPRRARPPMSLGELTAWQAGVDWGRAGLTRTDYAKASKATLAGLLEPPALHARAELGQETFAYWLLKGLDDFKATGRV